MGFLIGAVASERCRLNAGFDRPPRPLKAVLWTALILCLTVAATALVIRTTDNYGAKTAAATVCGIIVSVTSINWLNYLVLNRRR